MTTEPNPPVNPPWVRPVVLGLVALIWVMTLIAVAGGDPWHEAVFWAVIGTICLSAVDIGTGLRPARREERPVAPRRHGRSRP